MANYRKKCSDYNVDFLKSIKELSDLIDANEIENINKFHFWDELGWAGCRAIMDSLKEAQYPHA